MKNEEEIIYIEIVILLHVFFQDVIKINRWLNTPNPLLGNSSPISLVKVGRGEKVLAFIKNALDENKSTVDKYDFAGGAWQDISTNTIENTINKVISAWNTRVEKEENEEPFKSY